MEGDSPTLKSRAKLMLARAPAAYAWAHRCSLVVEYLLRRPHERDLVGFGRCTDREGLFLDIGANIGRSAMTFRLLRPAAPILSIEPNPLLARDMSLLKRLLPHFDYRLCAASN